MSYDSTTGVVTFHKGDAVFVICASKEVGAQITIEGAEAAEDITCHCRDMEDMNMDIILKGKKYTLRVADVFDDYDDARQTIIDLLS